MASWAPELQVIVILAAILSLTYFVVYPLLKPRSLGRLAIYDLVLLVIILVVIGTRFGGTAFSMRVIETNWLVYTVIICMILEAPLFLWYVRRHGLDRDT